MILTLLFGKFMSVTDRWIVLLLVSNFIYLNTLIEFSATINDSLAAELAEILLEGDAVDIELDGKNSGSAFRAFRKLSIDYEIIE